MTGRGQPPGKLISRLGGNRFFCPKKKVDDAFLFTFVFIFYSFWLSLRAQLQSLVKQVVSRLLTAVLFQAEVVVREKTVRFQVFMIYLLL
jgi:hypothetical protein